MKKKIYILLTLGLVLAISSIAMTVEVAGSGMEIYQLEEKRQNLEKQKQSLEEELVKSLSVKNLSEKSPELGFTKPADLVYLGSTSPVANAK